VKRKRRRQVIVSERRKTKKMMMIVKKVSQRRCARKCGNRAKRRVDDGLREGRGRQNGGKESEEGKAQREVARN
jgi:hypothetical protein